MAEIKLRKIMKQRKMSFRKLAYMTGIDRSMLTRIAKGKRSPDIDQLEILSEKLELKIYDFFDSDYK